MRDAQNEKFDRADMDIEEDLLEALQLMGVVRRRQGQCASSPKLYDVDDLLPRIDEINRREAAGSSCEIMEGQHRLSQLSFGFLPGTAEGAAPLPSSTLPQGRIQHLLKVVEKAFTQVRGLASTDRVLIDPVLNRAFLVAAEEHGARATPYELNTTLLYGRKLKKFEEMSRSERFSVPDERLNEFSFASEIAVRYIREWQYCEFQRKISLDTIFCDPFLVTVFDEVASKLAPGDYTKFEYRWAALKLRKAGRMMSALPKIQPRDFEDLGSTRNIRLSAIPRTAGLYCFRSRDVPVYFGHADSLRAQITRHFDVGGTAVVPEWLVKRTYEDMRLDYVPVPGLSPSRREALKSSYVNCLSPQLNWLRKLPLFAA